MQFTLNLKLVLKLTGNVSLFARNYKILPSNTGEDSEFLIPQEQRRGFRISDPQTTLEIQNFWPPPPPQKKTTNKQTSKQTKNGRRFRISDSPNKNTIQEGFQYLGIPKNIVVESEFLITQTTWEKLHIFLSGLKAVKCLRIWGWSQHMILEQCKDFIVPRYKLYSIASVTSNTCSTKLNFIIEGISSCLLPTWALSDQNCFSW